MSVYITKSGDMWDAIAYTQLGSTSYTGALMMLNTQHLDICVFPAGIALTLPEVERERASIPDSLPPWRRM